MRTVLATVCLFLTVAQPLHADPKPHRKHKHSKSPGGPGAPTASGTPAHWGYDPEDGPDRWGNLDPSFAACETGTRQSPIDLGVDAASRIIAHGAIRYSQWPEIPCMYVHNNGHTVKFLPEPGSPPLSFTYQRATYNVLEMHVHTPSEHHVHNEHADLELHIVAQQQGGTALVVHGVMWQVGSDQDAEAVGFWESLPQDLPQDPDPDHTDHTPDLKWENVPVDKLFQAVDSFQNAFTYPGSLTTPPCSETVTWVVAVKQLPICVETLKRIRNIVKFNARELQQSGGKAVQGGPMSPGQGHFGQGQYGRNQGSPPLPSQSHYSNPQYHQGSQYNQGPQYHQGQFGMTL